MGVLYEALGDDNGENRRLKSSLMKLHLVHIAAESRSKNMEEGILQICVDWELLHRGQTSWHYRKAQSPGTRMSKMGVR